MRARTMMAVLTASLAFIGSTALSQCVTSRDDPDPYKRKVRSKGEKARNRKYRGK